MSGCAAQSFAGITQEQFNALLEKAAAAGMPLSGNSGSGSKNGIGMRWDFDPAAGTLTIECTDKPMLIPCGIITSKIQEVVNNALQSVRA